MVDLGEGRISGVRYNSIAPLDERLKALRLPFGEQVNRAGLLTALHGARVEVRNGSATATGRLLSAEKERKANGKGDFYDVTEFSIVPDTGEIRTSILIPVRWPASWSAIQARNMIRHKRNWIRWCRRSRSTSNSDSGVGSYHMW